MKQNNPNEMAHIFRTHLGWVGLRWHGETLCRVTFGHTEKRAAESAVGLNISHGRSVSKEQKRLVDRVLAFSQGAPDTFADVPIALGKKTVFQTAVLNACRRIPYGSTCSYAELAKAAGRPRAARAVGSTMAKNPLPLVIPCHRVVASNAGIGGFSAPGGLSTKQRLLGARTGGVMNGEEITSAIREGRTDLVFDLLRLPDWKERLSQGPVKLLQWFVYYNDVTALRAVLEADGDLESINLDTELGHAAFFGHWKVCDFLLEQGAHANSRLDDTHETPLHGALAKAGRPYYLYVVRLLVEHGADVNACTKPGVETEAFMRDVRTKGETPLHRAAAYADTDIIQYLLDHGANREARDVRGDTPLTWASEHLRPGKILALLQYGSHRVSPAASERITSDHGVGWGNGMERNLLGDYRPLCRRSES